MFSINYIYYSSSQNTLLNNKKKQFQPNYQRNYLFMCENSTVKSNDYLSQFERSEKLLFISSKRVY